MRVGTIAALAAALFVGHRAYCQTTGESSDSAPQRPAILFNRWQEDWSVLADPRVPREPFDTLKYIQLSTTDPGTYLSFGANVRERFEDNDAAGFGTGANHDEQYLLSRTEVHADLRIASQVQAFVQLESDFAPEKTPKLPVDQDRLDVEQAFVALKEPLSDGTLQVRIGRQQMAFDLQRFVSVRDGTNVRQSYDAVWADYEKGPWQFATFYDRPVQNQDLRPFDDYSSDQLTYSGVRAERKLWSSSNIALYYSRFMDANSHFLAAAGAERRDIWDLHFAGAAQGFDWEAEGMEQSGQIGTQDIRAWAVGSLTGYTFADEKGKPRIALQFDAASGDNNPKDHVLQTFNPLFPNGVYFTLAGYTGYVNVIHVKTSLTLQPETAVKIMLTGGAQWRETTGDAIYTFPAVPVAGTAGHPGRYTGSYGQARVDWAVTRAASFALEAVHFVAGDALRSVGGHDSNYLGIQFDYGW